MSNFFAIYKGEFKKMFNRKKIIIFASLLLILSIIGTIIFEQNLKFQQREIRPSDIPSESYGKMNDDITIDMEIAAYKISLQELETKYAKGEIKNFEYRELKKNINASIIKLEYIKNNDINPDIAEFGQVSINKSAGDYILFIYQMLLGIIVIFVIVLSAGTITNELKEGTIKLLLIRPVDRNKLLSIKLFTIISIGFLLMLAVLILTLIYGLIRFGVNNVPVLFMFNASKIFIGNKAGQVALTMFISFILMVGYIEMTAFLATLSKNNALSMSISIAVYLGISSLLIRLLRLIGLNLHQWIFSTHVNWMVHFMPENMTSYSFYFTLIMYTVYVGLFSFFNHLIFSKRDVN